MVSIVGTSYVRAHEMLWKMGYWRYLLLPVLFSVVFAFLLLGSCGFFAYGAGMAVENYFYPQDAAPSWLRPLATLLLFIIGLGPCYIVFRSLVLLCYSPFLNRLSTKTETWLLGEIRSEEKGLAVTVRRLLLMALFSLSLSLLVLVVSLLLGWIPVIGWIVVVLLFPLQMFLSSLSYLDPYLERRGYSAGASLRLMWKNRASVFVFGVAGFLITLIPLVGWFVGPTYSVVAGIVFGVLLLEKERP